MIIITEIFGRLLTKVMSARDISVAQIAEEVNVSPRTVHRWREGRHMPQYYFCNRLAKALCFPFDLFIGFRGTISNSEFIEILSMMQRTEDFVLAIEGLSITQHQALTQTVLEIIRCR